MALLMQTEKCSVRRWFAVATVALCVQAGSASRCIAGDDLRMMAQTIKAGLLYNFLKYTEWPEDRHAPAPKVATLCIFGDDPFHGSLRPMAERTVNRRRIVLRPVREISDAEACNLLFVNAAEEARWPQLSAFLSGKSVLTVSDLPGFSASGGMVELGRDDDRIDVRIDMTTVTAARLVVDERLLRLSRVVGARSP